ncbi:MogA/MoaB family molybdenum cofactor biosynthesis protein [Pontibacillus yanchengensis]|uniref:Molybdenum cofactor biosynthesis protein B n=1 Tax=Pontibacillus yanchengensis Y32 TaxID=1385514 RepID=A0A0A2TGS7_9BACI|nr:MogA/MoaB family molybdenum cofactor biosynthesis protein [Pontibacillus yanchengensis]KGP73638.1 molybdenum cofactor biosynthesis protein B [Pontibacillus yanchengensis Y32]
MSVSEHKQHSKASITCKVITISDTRDQSTDKSGKLMMDFLTTSGHVIKDYVIVEDNQQAIREAIDLGCKDDEIEAVLTNGGTGMAKRDVTIETVEDMLDKEMVGFGELFRMLSYTEDIGSAAILSRAIAGVRNKTVLFSTPGSTGAVRLAMEKLIIPELPHVVWELSK